MKIMRLNKKWIVFLLLLAGVLALALWPSGQQAPIKFIDRSTGIVKTEKVAGEKWLVWLYYNPVGEVSLQTLVKRKFLSSVYGYMMDRSSSTDKIQPFVEEFDIDMRIVQKQQFSSFNDFFTRKLKKGARPVDTISTVLVSPADGKIMAWADISRVDFIIKGYKFDVVSFLNDSMLGNDYHDGSLIIIRLAPNDYHRFHFPVSGQVSSITHINGDYYSVNPIALHKMAEIFCLNKREYVIISNPIFEELIMAEVGATMVGSIIQTYEGKIVTKGQEKGYFEFGGSTIVLLFEKGKINIDKDLLINTARRLETTVKMGERIGIGLSDTDP